MILTSRLSNQPKSRLAYLAFLMLAFSLTAFGQNVSSSLEGSVLDPADAAVPKAHLELKDMGTGSVRQGVSNDAGFFEFLSLPPATYTLTASANGFKSATLTNIVLNAAEKRTVRISLAIGNITDSVSVSADVTPIQTSSSEKAALIDSSQFESVPLKGRDLFGFMNLLPGVVDTATRDVTSPNGLSNITINGNTSSKNFTVDGVTDIDTGGDGTVHYEPNMDSIQELRVLSSNYQAEFGRNSGGSIMIVTKSGGQNFHGSGWWYHRHEGLNANDFFRNQNGLPRLPYRYNIEGWSLGGPAFIPHLLNTSKKKLFFFASQEYTGQLNGGATSISVAPPVQFRTVATALERKGDFSRTVDGNGALIPIIDPLTGAQFTGNIIPGNRIDPIGSKILSLMPLPNYSPGPGNPNYLQANFTDSAVSAHPRRNDVARADVYLTSKLSAYARWIHDFDDLQNVPYQEFPWSSCCRVDHPNPGHGYAASITDTISPTTVNDFTFGKSFNTWSWYNESPAQIDRSIIGLPTLFSHNFTGETNVNGEHNYIPSISFGSNTPNTADYQIGDADYFNSNDIWSFDDNLSKVWRKHTFKAGLYIEKTWKLQPADQNNTGALSFNEDNLNPLDSGDGYSNALLGNADSYTEQSIRAVSNFSILLREFYLQDNWRVSRRLTLDLGVRFYSHGTLVDHNHAIGFFNPALYSKLALPRLYVPGCKVAVTGTCASANQVAVDPATGVQAPQTYIGNFVPGSGNQAAGMEAPGLNGIPLNYYTQAALVAAPRIGFAFDVFGDGKMAIRGGFGVFYNTLNSGTTRAGNAQGAPPVGSTATVSYTPLSGLTQGSGVSAPQRVYSTTGDYPWDYVHNGSIGVQRGLGHSIVLDVSYVGNWAHHLPLTVNLNAVPLGADFQPANISPVTGSALTQAGSALLRPNYPGYLDINRLQFLGHTSYNALQTTLNRRLSNGLQFGVAYTWAHSMGTVAVDPLVANNETRNHGPTGADRRQVLAINYAYELPKPGKILGNRFVGAVTDNWTLSGVTSFSTGAPISPSCSRSGLDITGSTSETARCRILGDGKTPTVAGTRFNTAAFGLATVGTIGDAGLGVLRGPGYANSDATMTKTIPLGTGDRRGLKLGVQAYNVFNHTEISAWGTSARFNKAGTNTTGSFGLPTAARPARILAFSLRLEF